MNRSPWLSVLRFSLWLLLPLAWLVTGCMESKQLRMENTALEGQRQSLEQERDEYKKAYYDVVAMREKEKKAEESAKRQIERRLETLRAEQAQQKEIAERQKTELQGRIDTLTTERERLEAELRQTIATLQTDLEKTGQERQKALDEKNALQTTRDEMQKNLADITTERDQLRAQIAQVEQRAVKAEQEAAGLKNQLAEKTAAAEEANRLLKLAQEELARLKTQALAAPPETKAAAAASPVPPAATPDAAAQRIGRIAGDLRQALKTSRAPAQEVSVAVAGNGAVARLSSDWLFASQSIVPADSATSTLQQLADVARRHPDTVLRIEGHTDNTPVRALPFPDNWGVASARADAIVRWFEMEGKIPGHRLTSIGRSYFTPLNKDNTPEARRQNRRVEIWFTLP